MKNCETMMEEMMEKADNIIDSTIIKTFDMLCDRMSNTENTLNSILEHLQDKELAKTNGKIDNKLFGYSFAIEIQDNDSCFNDSSITYVNKNNAAIIYVDKKECTCEDNYFYGKNISKQMMEKTLPELFSIDREKTVYDDYIDFLNEKDNDDNMFYTSRYNILSPHQDLLDEINVRLIKQDSEQISTLFFPKEYNDSIMKIYVSLEMKLNYMTFVKIGVECMRKNGHTNQCINRIQILPCKKTFITFIYNVLTLENCQNYISSIDKNTISKKIKELEDGYAIQHSSITKKYVKTLKKIIPDLNFD